MDAVALAKRPKPPRSTPLTRMLEGPAPRVTALDALALAQKKWIAGERLDIGKLADELGIGRATLFRWVGDKDALYGEVVSAAFAQTFEWAKRASKGKGAQFLTEVTHNLLRALLASQPLRHFITQDAEFAMRIVMSSSSPVEHRVITLVRELIESEVNAGNLEPAMEVGALAYIIVRIAESFLYRDVLTGERPDHETATKAIGLLFTAQSKSSRRKSSR